MPPEQLTDMAEVLSQLRVDFDQIRLAGDLHGFEYWPSVRNDALPILAIGLGR